MYTFACVEVAEIGYLRCNFKLYSLNSMEFSGLPIMLNNITGINRRIYDCKYLRFVFKESADTIRNHDDDYKPDLNARGVKCKFIRYLQLKNSNTLSVCYSQL